MVEIDLGKISVTPEGAWSPTKPYEALSIVSFEGASYLSLNANVGDKPTPDKVMDNWMLLADRGESLYEMYVRKGLFSGTEDDFLKLYQDKLDAAQAAADRANKSAADADNINKNIQKQEDIRQKAETGRASAEGTRIQNEAARKEAEDGRVQANIEREAIFLDRTAQFDAMTQASAQAENEREANETKRVAQESTRQDNEYYRKTAEQGRVTAEEARISAETVRADQEVKRETNEGKRKDAELVRESNEKKREQYTQSVKDAEDLRVQAEQGRVTEESKRATAESGRVTAESNRAKAEEARVAEHADLKQKSEAATNAANQATTKANTAATTIDAKINPVIENDKKQDARLDTVEAESAWNAMGNPPQWVKDSLHRYYNVPKLGITNEAMKKLQDAQQKQYLKDFSPNHLDMELRGFNWKEMSGMNGYSTNFEDWHTNIEQGDVQDITHKSFRIKAIKNLAGFFYSYVPKSFKFKVSGLKGITLLLGITGNNDYTIIIDKDGVYSINIPDTPATSGKSISFKGKSPITSCDIFIELLPLYEGALCFDGVDDYGISEGQPSTQGTILVNRKNIPYSISGQTLTLGKSKPCVLYSFAQFNRKLTPEEEDWFNQHYMSDGSELTDNVRDSDRMEIINQTNKSISVGQLKDYFYKDFADLSNTFNDVYGVEMNRGQADPNFQTWIGKEEYKESHPILNDFKIAKVKNGEVVAVLDQADWFKLDNGEVSNVVYNSAMDDDDTDVLLVNTRGFYAILGGHDEVSERYLFSRAAFTYKGEVAEYIEPFGMTPDFSVIKNGVQRSIRDNTIAGTKGTGSLGITIFNDNGYPTTVTSRFNYERYARAKNSDNTSNMPYANAFQRDLRIWCALMFVKFRTKDFHGQKYCGGGISCNDGTVSEETWGNKTGMRTRTSADTPWTYQSINGDRWNTINGYKPLLKMFDCQLALSYAREKNIFEDATFKYDGATWKYKNITGHKGLSDGCMTAIVTKFLASPDGNTEVCLVQPIVNGSILFYGNIWRWVSGIEVVLDHDANEAHIYQTDDVSSLMTDSDSAEKEIGGTWGFENKYKLIAKRVIGAGYAAKDYIGSLMTEKNGGSLHTNESHYNYLGNNGGAGKLARRGVLFGGVAYNDCCSSRYGNAIHAPSYTSSTFGGGFRVSLTQTQA